ncbi:hypothetical protein SAMN05877838_3777 [Hoeflea halophila]|uniref:Uncharacterized protein n=1 Tax=Hoeflea halophila TaxID=714899 RepID=A0A286IFB5_9HYPH|nr:hypothetical protein [Hoeflea halophila]SOE18833.1 hypothetical protein SAMN05877838_3777 [Hoeflea halophila]
MPMIQCSDGTHLEAGEDEYVQFRDWLAVDSDLAQRISELFWLDMFVGYKRSSLDCRSVLETVKNLEKGEPKNGVRPASEFTRPPLKGLWHKHHYSGPYLPMNVANNLPDEMLKELVENLKTEDISPEEQNRRCLGEAMKLVKHSLADRSADQRLTGEWIIFAKSDAGNLYLSLGYHKIGRPAKGRDEFLIGRIREHCVNEFPNILRLKE